MKAAVEGEEVPLEALAEITDWGLVSKVRLYGWARL